MKILKFSKIQMILKIQQFPQIQKLPKFQKIQKTLQRYHRHFGALQRSVLPIRFRYTAVSRYCLPSRFLAILTTPKSTNPAAQMAAAIQAT